MLSYRLNQLHRNLEKKLGTDNTRFNNDLENWSKKYGPESETKWPVFEVSWLIKYVYFLVSGFPFPFRFLFIS